MVTGFSELKLPLVSGPWNAAAACEVSTVNIPVPSKTGIAIGIPASTLVVAAGSFISVASVVVTVTSSIVVPIMICVSMPVCTSKFWAVSAPTMLPNWLSRWPSPLRSIAKSVRVIGAMSLSTT